MPAPTYAQAAAALNSALALTRIDAPHLIALLRQQLNTQALAGLASLIAAAFEQGVRAGINGATIPATEIN